MSNATIRKFGYPDTLVVEYEHWVVLVRAKQVTAGSLVVACKEEATCLPDVTAEAYAELRRVTGELESAVRETFQFEKINYLLLMMTDPHVHFHVLPRYSAPRQVCGITFEDTAWPGPPDIRRSTQLTMEQVREVQERIWARWPNREAT